MPVLSSLLPQAQLDDDLRDTRTLRQKVSTALSLSCYLSHPPPPPPPLPPPPPPPP